MEVRQHFASVQLGYSTLADIKTPHLLLTLTSKDKCVPNSLFPMDLNTSIHYINTTHFIFFCLRYRVNGQQRRATCFATLPQNELFEKRCCASCPQSNLSCNKSGCCRLRKVVAVTREQLYILEQNLHMLRVLPAQGNLVLQHVTTPVYGIIQA